MGTFHLWVLWRWMKHFWMEEEIKMERWSWLKHCKNKEEWRFGALVLSKAKHFFPLGRWRAEQFRVLNSEFRLCHLPIGWIRANHSTNLSYKMGLIPYFIGYFCYKIGIILLQSVLVKTEWGNSCENSAYHVASTHLTAVIIIGSWLCVER